jgi:hypothetical protein
MALESAEELWKREGRTPVPADVAVKAWGYSSLSGPARSRIAALKQYGLLDESQGGLRVSDLAIEIIQHPEGSTERRNAIAQSALMPDLFRELSKTHGQASDDALKAYLVTRRQFTEDGAKQFIRAFRDTMGLVKLSDSDYAPSRERKETELLDQTMNGTQQETPKTPITKQPVALGVPVSPGLIAEIRFLGNEEVTPQAVDMLADYLRLMRKAISQKAQGSSEEDKANSAE